MREHRGVSASRSPPRESFSFSKRHGMLLLDRLNSSHACVHMWCSICDRMERCIFDCTARRRLWCLTPDSHRKVSLLRHLYCSRYSGGSTHDRQWKQSTLLIGNVAVDFEPTGVSNSCTVKPSGRFSSALRIFQSISRMPTASFNRHGTSELFFWRLIRLFTTNADARLA
jgi:hypothetical protein